MLNDNRQQYVIQTNDPKGDEWFGKAFGGIAVVVLSLAIVQAVYETVVAWYQDTIVWLNDTATYLAGLWPF